MSASDTLPPALTSFHGYEGMSEAEACRRFVARYGYEPAQVLRYTGRLWLGPVGQPPTPEPTPLNVQQGALL